MQIRMILKTCALICVAATFALADERRPDPGILHGHYFDPVYDGICGQGGTLSEGCEAIRAREIVDAASAPWKAIGRVNFASIRLRHHCTGTLISERIVLTAAHCLYNFRRKAWIPPTSVTFVAGYQRGSSIAVSRGRRFVLDPLEDVTSRDFRSQPHQDWAFVVLEDPIGREVGYLKLLEAGASQREKAEFRLAGYSGLRPNVLSVASDCGPAMENWPTVLLQKCSAMLGDSGAPLLVSQSGGYAVAGVLSGIVAWPEGLTSLSVPTSAFWDAWSAEQGK